MNELVKEPKWYTIEELASMCGISVETLKKGNSPLVNLSIDFEADTRLGGYHNTKKYYSENVLKALKEYQLKNYVPNALKDKETAVMDNVSFVQKAVKRLNETSDLLPNYSQGQTPRFTEEQATLIKQKIQRHHNSYI